MQAAGSRAGNQSHRVELQREHGLVQGHRLQAVPRRQVKHLVVCNTHTREPGEAQSKDAFGDGGKQAEHAHEHESYDYL